MWLLFSLLSLFSCSIPINFTRAYNETVKTQEGVLCSVIEHGMTSLSIETAIQKNKAMLSSFVQFENEMASYCAL